MVHALVETWRVLKPGGRLVDLRPYSTGWPLEVLTPGGQDQAGLLDDSIGLPLDIASDDAIQTVIDRGWLRPETKTTFEFTYYWDTVDGMHAFLRENWKKSATVPRPVLTKARRLARQADGPVQIRIRRTMHLASYRRQPDTRS